MEKKRSVGVMIIAFLLILYSFWRLPGEIHSLLTGGFKVTLDYDLSATQQFYKLIGEVIFAFLLLVGGVGVLLIKPWARKLSTYVALVYASWNVAWGLYIARLASMYAQERVSKGELSNFPPVYYGSGFFTFGVMPFVCFFVFVFYFLTRHRVKEQFK